MVADDGVELRGQHVDPPINDVAVPDIERGLLEQADSIAPEEKAIGCFVRTRTCPFGMKVVVQ
jgi:hypothetical protein